MAPGKFGWMALMAGFINACGQAQVQSGGAGSVGVGGGSAGTIAATSNTDKSSGGTAGGSSATGGTSSAGTPIGGAPATGGVVGGAAFGGAGSPAPGGSTSASGGATNSRGGAGGNVAGSNGIGGKSSGGTSTNGGVAAGGKSSGGAAGASKGGGASGGRPQIAATPGTTLVKIDPALRHQTFEGWGTSLCWWANRIGGWSTDKKNQFLDLIVNPSTGLGYNVFRFNIGGGDDPSHSHMGQYRDMPGFQPTKGTWSWDADARQTSVVSRLVAIGQNVILEAFSNSPPYWMTKSGCASGSSDGSNNLKDDSYDVFAGYLTDVVKHYRDALGITFRTLEAMNEPNANWWKSQGSQEGCHFGASNQQQIIKAVGAQLTAKGLTDTQVSASDENSMDDAYSIISGYDSTTLGYVAQINAHSYAGSKRSQLRTLATSKGKRLWQSESGPLSVTLASNTEAAIFMAERIITDLRELQPQAWIDWQTVDTSTPWTSFSVNDAQQTGTPQKRFYMHAGFSRYIRPGATFVEIDNANMVAAVAGDGSVLTVVVRNGDSAATANYTFDLTALASVGTAIEVYRTSATEDLAHLTPITLKNWSFTTSSTPYSVTTYLIPLGG